MRKVIYAMSAVLLAACAPQSTDGQQEPQLQHIAEVHVKPSGVALFEAAHLERNERIAAAGVSFLFRSSVSESLVYRFVSPVGDVDGLARRDAEMGRMAAPAAGQLNGNDAIDYVDTYTRWTRPDLSYTPTAPRVATADWQAIQRIRIYVHQGKVAEVADVLGEIRDFYTQHSIPETYSVTVQGVGPDGPVVEVQLFGASLSDIYEVGEQLNQEHGSEMNAFRGRVGALARRVQIDNFAIRRDLNYQPSN